MLFANILQQFYSFVDMVMIGKGLGDAAVAAVGNFTTVSFLITGFIMGVTNGFSVILSQTYGEKDFAAFRKAAASSIMLSVVFSLYLTGVGLWGQQNAFACDHCFFLCEYRVRFSVSLCT